MIAIGNCLAYLAVGAALCAYAYIIISVISDIIFGVDFFDVLSSGFVGCVNALRRMVSSDKRAYKLAALKERCFKRQDVLRQLVSDGEALAKELGATNAAERCQALVDEHRASLAEAEAEVIRVDAALCVLKADERNIENFSHLLEFYKKSAKVNLMAKTGLEEIESAIATSRASRERILGELHSAEVAAMGPEVPIEVLEASVKDFALERSRLRAAQERALTTSG